MIQKKFAKSLALVLATVSAPVAASAATPFPERANAQYYVAPPAVSVVSRNSAPASTTGQSNAPPVNIDRYVHPAERQAITSWIWDARTVFAAKTVVYAGWNRGHLINVLHFLNNGGQQSYLRQYIMHYERTPAGDEVVKVERYKCDGQCSEKYAGKTTYVSKLVGNKLYLCSVEWTDSYAAEETRLDVQWTSTGVSATIRQGSNVPSSLNLKSSGTWLAQHFDLWTEFGLKFQ